MKIRQAAEKDAETISGIAVQMWKSHTIKELSEEFKKKMKKKGE